MLNKTRIALLVAGGLFAIQAGAQLGQPDDMMWSDESPTGSQQISVFYPDGSSYSIAPVEIEVATLEPVEIEVTTLEPVVVIAMNEDISTASLARTDGYPVNRDFSTIEENHRLNVEYR